ncbi:hypothetical protein EON66_10680 [archaeon]|nr:MAG: hypothetical protein EON66_10680 [archaeon]
MVFCAMDRVPATVVFTGISFDDRYVPLTVTTAAGIVPRGQGAASAGSAAHRMPAADSAGNPLAAVPSSESVGTLGGGSWFRAYRHFASSLRCAQQCGSHTITEP